MVDMSSFHKNRMLTNLKDVVYEVVIYEVVINIYEER